MAVRRKQRLKAAPWLTRVRPWDDPGVGWGAVLAVQGIWNGHGHTEWVWALWGDGVPKSFLASDLEVRRK